ncbi:MAG: amino acid ABC transporter permease [Alphaproteobacteria bacterium]|nr:MAG: amino acid ABC transporter permease [Alphaproteobacteria bacterium]
MSFDWNIVWSSLPRLLDGAWMTIWLACVTMLLAIPGGLVLALLRLSKIRPLAMAATGFVEFFRATPLILQIYWVYYVLPAYFDVQLSQITTAIVGLVCNISAFNSETFRSGIVSIRQGQWNAAYALGMTPANVFLRIIAPQALTRVLPALASTWVSLFKDTSLVSIIAVAELSYVSLQIRAETYRILEVLTAMAALYWLMGYPQAKLVDWVHHRFKVAE